jgi:co-chaperonin GroES (HSP10)
MKEKTTLQLLHDNILILEDKEEDKFGIKSDSLSVRAEVYGVGPDVTDIEVGNIIYLSKYSGLPYKEYRIVQEHEILGVESEY